MIKPQRLSKDIFRSKAWRTFTLLQYEVGDWYGKELLLRVNPFYTSVEVKWVSALWAG